MTGSLFLLCCDIPGDESKSCLMFNTFSDWGFTARVILAT